MTDQGPTISENSTTTEPKTFDDILETKLGFGRYQYLLYAFVGLAFSAEAAFIFCFSLVIPIIKNEWNLSENLVSSLGSSIFMGIFMGSVSAGFVTDKLGRKTSLILSCVIQILLGVTVQFISNFEAFFALRVGFGFLIGFTLPLCLSMLSEITTIALRGKALIFCNVFFTCGRLYVIMAAFITLDDLQSGDWRGTVLYCCTLPLIALIGTLIYVYESPRFEIAFGRMEKGVDIIRKIGIMNKGTKFTDIDEQDQRDLKSWQEKNFTTTEKVSPKSLFGSGYRAITLNLWMMWLSVAFCSYGLNFILPFVLEDLGETQGTGFNPESGTGTDTPSQPQGDRNDFWRLAAPNFIELPTILVGILIIEVKIFGRKNTLILCFALAFVCFLLSMILPAGSMIYFVSAARFFISLAFGVIYPFSAEVYSTKYRTVGIGMASAVGRLGTVLMPWITIHLRELATRAPFGFFALLSLLSAICGLTLPYDTTGQPLDAVANQKQSVHVELQDEIGSHDQGEERTKKSFEEYVENQ